MDFVQQFVMHPRADASPIMPMHICLVKAGGEQWAPSEMLPADATLEDIIAAFNALVVPARDQAESTAGDVLADAVPEPVSEDVEAVPDQPVQAEAGPKPTMDWLKDDLVAYALQHGVEVEGDDTKADILDKLGL